MSHCSREPAPDLPALSAQLRACRICVERPEGPPLPHAPNPIFRVHRDARICIASQAAGARAHASSTPFMDPSGVRLRDWMGIGEDAFYDRSRIAIVPMGFCFPGYDAKGADIPPRKECAPAWRDTVFRALPNLRLLLLIGLAAQKWHLGTFGHGSLTANVERWRDYQACTRLADGRIASLDGTRGAEGSMALEVIPTPHPSWRNNAWLARNRRFEAEVLPHLRARVHALIGAPEP